MGYFGVSWLDLNEDSMMKRLLLIALPLFLIIGCEKGMMGRFIWL